MKLKPTEIKPLEGFKLWIKFSDGTEGTMDYSDKVGKGVFAEWNKPGVFEKAYIAYHGSAIAWSENLDVDALNIYLQITGKTFEELPKNLLE